MALHWIDWSIFIGILLIIIGLGVYTRRYAGSVVNFLAAGRCSGRYLLAVSEGIAGFGAISAIAGFEMTYKAGFSMTWWAILLSVAMILISMSGWCIYRFRETRALTLAQFLEARYSRRFRVFMGILAWIAGVLNFGLFPAVGARFFIYFCGLPEWNVMIGGFQLSLMYALVMIVLLSVALYLIFIGGMISVIVTDFVQGIICNLAFVVLPIVLLCQFGWPSIVEATGAAPAGQSMLNPFDSAATADFNVWYYIIAMFGAFYTLLSWQGVQGYRSAATSPHESRMASILGNWRAMATVAALLLLPICAFTFMHHISWSTQAAQAQAVISSIPGQTLQIQQTVPVALRFILPTGALGIMATMMMAAFIGNHDTYLHSWGSIFIQDVIIPLRKTPPTQEQHVRWLKWSIFGVAIFIFFFSLLYTQNEYILMFFAMTGAIFLSGAGAAVIGGLYWQRGTTTGAWSAVICGLTITLGGALLRRLWPDFPLNSMWLFFISCVTSSVLYVLVSLFGNTRCNMDKLFHRGPYRVENDKQVATLVTGWRALIGIDEHFTVKDKIIYIGSLVWTLGLIIIFFTGIIVNALFGFTDAFWADFWHIYIWFFIVIAIVVTIWFMIGGLIDFRRLFKRLASAHVDTTDDGRN